MDGICFVRDRVDRAEGITTAEFGRHDWHIQGERLVNVKTIARPDNPARWP